MVTFIKENLLGSVKEFRNRFINPIQNGQCADSTLHDVRIMKKRAHILYEMLAGCVQVKQTNRIGKKILVFYFELVSLNVGYSTTFVCAACREKTTQHSPSSCPPNMSMSCPSEWHPSSANSTDIIWSTSQVRRCSVLLCLQGTLQYEVQRPCCSGVEVFQMLLWWL